MTTPHSTDLLAQRFVDHDLTAEERDLFAGRMGRDGRLRRQVIALQQVATAAGHLSKPIVSAAFVAGVLERTSVAAPPRARASRLAPPPKAGQEDAAHARRSLDGRRRSLAWLTTPRTLQWNLAQAAAAVVVIAAAAVGVGRTLGPLTTAGEPNAAATPVMVRLVVLQPEASSVHAVGDFNGWDPARTSLQQVSSGMWTVTLPLTPGRYEYMFVVDGQRWVGDPSAVEQADDGFGSRNAVLEVQPPGAPL